MKDDDKVVCPACGGTHIQAHPRGFSWMWGFFGSAGVRITCLRCGHKFLPGGVPLRSATLWVLGVPGVVLVIFIVLVEVGEDAQRDRIYSLPYSTERAHAAPDPSAGCPNFPTPACGGSNYAGSDTGDVK